MPRRTSRLTVLLGTALMTLFNVTLPADAQTPSELLVCADRDNLPFSNDKLEGFENKIASLIAQELDASLRYTWNAPPRGFRPRMLTVGDCNLVIGVPVGFPGLSVTRPYYASTYVFVSQRERNLDLRSFDDPRLRGLKIGLQAIGAEGANTPPASALARRGLSENIVGYSMWGEAGERDPQSRIIDAVAQGEIDVAAVWGPLAGYFAKRHGDRLVLTPVAADPQMPALTFSYDISVGASKGADKFTARLQAALDRKQQDIHAILNDYGIPLVRMASGSTLSATP